MFLQRKAKHLFFLGLVSIGCVAIASITLNFSDLTMESLKKNFTTTWFVGGGNDFGGGIFWLNVLDIPGTITDANGDSVVCEKQVGGFYYNPARGLRLRPLDPDSLAYLQDDDPSYSTLDMTGGIYTLCSGTIPLNPANRFGQITYNRSGDTSYLLLGVEMDITNNTFAPYLKPSFEFFNGIPLGFLYDSAGGVGFVGGALTGDCLSGVLDSIHNGGLISDIFVFDGQDLVVANDTGCVIQDPDGIEEIMMGIAIRGNVGVGQTLTQKNKQGFQSDAGDKTVFHGTNISNAKLFETVATNAGELCRGKEEIKNSDITISLADTEGQNLICITYPSYDGKVVTFDPGDPDALKTFHNKTFIIRNADVQFTQTMKPEQKVALYVDNGNIFVNSVATQKVGFDKQGYPSMTNPVAQGFLLQGVFVVNGLLLGRNTIAVPYTIGEIPYKLYINGKITTLNSLVTSDGRVTQVAKLPGSRAYTGFIPLEKVFTWSCNPISGSGSDGTSCGNTGDEHTFKSLIVIDAPFKETPLLGE